MKREYSPLVLLLFPLGLAAATGCADHPMVPMVHPAPAVLSPEARAQLAPVFDVQAAAKFFQTMSQEDANRRLEDMGVVLGQPPAETRDVVVPVSSTNPATQALLNQMWAPARRQPLNADSSATAGLRYPGSARFEAAGRARP